jgi:hypothetical protein
MITMYVNGDSHTAQVYGEDGVTATELLAKKYNCNYINDALPGGSNQRIIRTTLERLSSLDPTNTLIIIGWSSFERTEWYYNDQWHQICGDAYYNVDSELKVLWKQHLSSWWSDDNHECWRRQADQHNSIWVFHNLLHHLGYQTLFYQGCRTFFFDGCPQQDQNFQLPWHTNVWVHNPYVTLTPDNQRHIESFSHYVESQGYQHSDNRAHYGKSAHQCWADYLDPYVKTQLDLIQQQG